MVYRLSLLIILIQLIGYQSKCQTDKRLVQNKNFERTINILIDGSVPYISVDELYDNMGKYTLLDARELREYEVSHLEGALHIGYDHWNPKVLDSLDKDTPIIVYCSIGARSENIGEYIKERGFTSVKNLYGSIFEWVNRGYPIVDNAGYTTKQVHAYNKLWGRWIENRNYEKVFR